jgi:hypothetical protein
MVATAARPICKEEGALRFHMETPECPGAQRPSGPQGLVRSRVSRRVAPRVRLSERTAVLAPPIARMPQRIDMPKPSERTHMRAGTQRRNTGRSSPQPRWPSCFLPERSARGKILDRRAVAKPGWALCARNPGPPLQHVVGQRVKSPGGASLHPGQRSNGQPAATRGGCNGLRHVRNRGPRIAGAGRPIRATAPAGHKRSRGEGERDAVHTIERQLSG